MDRKEKQISLTQLVSWIGGVSCAAVLATWALAVRSQSNELEAYRKADAWNASETISEMRKLSSELNLKIAEKNELLGVKKLSAELLEVRSQLADITSERDQLRQAVDAISKPNTLLTVREGGSQYAVDNVILIAVADISRISNTCDVRAGNKREKMEIGRTIGGSMSGIDYRLTLTGVSADSCDFSFSRVN